MKKTIKNYTSSKVDLTPFEVYLERYNACKNLFYNEFWNKLDVVFKQGHRVVRNELVKDLESKVKVHPEYSLLVNLPSKLWKLSLEESFSNIKTTWTMYKKDVRKVINKNKDLTKTEKHYLNYVLKSDSILNDVLNEKNNVIDKFKYLEIIKLNKYLNRIIRKNKFNKLFTQGKSYMLEDVQYKFATEGGKLYISLSTLTKSKRIKLELSNKIQFKGNIRIVLRDGRLEIHKGVNVKVKHHADFVHEIGIDKGFVALLSTSSGKQYGNEFNILLKAKSNYLNDKNAKRHKLKQQVKILKLKGDKQSESKAERIVKNNLGTAKLDNFKRKTQEFVKSFVNNSINEMIKCEKPKVIACEDLSWSSKSKGKRNKKTNRWLSSWQKGYLQDRLVFKSFVNNIKLVNVNCAYTSKVCSRCGHFGVRNGVYFNCKDCGLSIDADINASINIFDRLYDSDISLYTKYMTVKDIINGRLELVALQPNTDASKTSMASSMEERMEIA
jgi:transposase